MQENFQIFENQVNLECNATVRVFRKNIDMYDYGVTLDIMQMESFFIKNNIREDVDFKYVHGTCTLERTIRKALPYSKIFPF